MAGIPANVYVVEANRRIDGWSVLTDSSFGRQHDSCRILKDYLRCFFVGWPFSNFAGAQELLENQLKEIPVEKLANKRFVKVMHSAAHRSSTNPT